MALVGSTDGAGCLRPEIYVKLLAMVKNMQQKRMENRDRVGECKVRVRLSSACYLHFSGSQAVGRGPPRYHGFIPSATQRHLT
jgi:hypothetical protein